ncbi:hypothetical protein [Priestia megaterium]|uniref:hypothetical protein n=1 Tax=Priestia megaterium TaxID=1404 RepID=UPI001D6D142F|nr:hypothetical protein [Priestia megaterium]CAH0323893.1 hypothetical protein SRABI82_05782 [Priestia megaterium]
MDMFLRNIDPIAVKIIDEIAKEKKISRQEFLKAQVETLAVFQEQSFTFQDCMEVGSQMQFQKRTGIIKKKKEEQELER